MRFARLWSPKKKVQKWPKNTFFFRSTCSIRSISPVNRSHMVIKQVFVDSQSKRGENHSNLPQNGPRQWGPPRPSEALWGPLGGQKYEKIDFFRFFPKCSRIILEYIWGVFKHIGVFFRCFLALQTPQSRALRPSEALRGPPRPSEALRGVEKYEKIEQNRFFPKCSRIILEYIWGVFKHTGVFFRCFLALKTPQSRPLRPS